MNIKIRHAGSAEGEFNIPNVGKVDGYCKENNTVYEYHGDYWHGNPLKFNPEDLNERANVTFGELYQRTVQRDNKIKQLGYNLVVKWESEDSTL